MGQNFLEYSSELFSLFHLLKLIRYTIDPCSDSHSSNLCPFWISSRFFLTALLRLICVKQERDWICLASETYFQLLCNGYHVISFYSCNLSQNSNLCLQYWTSQTAIAVCCQSQHEALLWNSKALSRFWVEGNESILLTSARKTRVCYKQLSFMSECCWRMKPLSDPSAEHNVAMLTLVLLTMHCLHWSIILTGYMSESQGSKLQGLKGKTWYLVLVVWSMASAHLLVTGAVHLWSM